MQIITTAAIKGGTGKTTTCAAIAQAARISGKRVLAIDLDPQSNLTLFLGADPGRPGSYQLLTGTPTAETIQETAQGIDTISGSADLSTIKTGTGSAKRLQKALEQVRESYDIIVIDTPPTMGELTFNALQASTGLIIPLETDGTSIQGLFQIVDIAEQMKRSNPGLKITGVAVTRYDGRPNINRQLKDMIAEQGQKAGAPLLTAIRAGISIREAQAQQVSLYEYAPTSKPAADYMELFNLISERR